ncbi:MAG: preprotein translocase subunit SecF [Actinobacteria bacterium BACL4 MAG-120820-bin23]|jgi:preprotein translocase subunit SecF|uniref:protein translocase subunit SecF n=1 Tax=Candidatus Nanopelagicus sp. TaxID=2518620 RepID=UPI00071407AA|nr:MAG: preprotein translocase subunit SecF [Actinobacteria bacterium BACL4 MAG-121022-bin9]KRO50866.1 MAG: preprotein translocase subunit SecF [Actinobacteria bacterium BACL4 MAG-120820-bin23]KRO51765.1 MAG: preprotein translocase subunit SecF [Actinobacteria bacterium BACL4 MAG-121001-bin59]KRO77511.1 MAG: preprotein translocase subunit SecF [Actinobacteria bacterium BACL4 MAG-120920-bin74]KRO92603.1 MAG: preprotein translocase subunit SecF [Actinobacteria bacterium BACL4 MAG-120507-bin0]HCP
MAKFSGLGGRLYRGETSVDFIGKRKIWYSFSLLLIIISGVTIFTQGLHLGIEFKGGSSFTVNSSNASINKAEDALSAAGIDSQTIIQMIGNDKVRIQTDALTGAEQGSVESALSSEFNVTIDSIDSQIIGPSWGEEITRKAIYGLLGFLLVVMIYLAMALEGKMAVAAIIAVVHDVFITVGIYAVVGFEVTPATVIGFLTILGYSLYDTVVVFDKVRENTKGIAASGRSTYSHAANLAVNQTIVRSFNTSLVALLPVGSILFVGAGLLGAGTLKDLSLALFIGLATGTYSSLCIATPILAALREREPAMQALRKRVGNRSDKPNTVSSVQEKVDRGPRNQPKRDRRR